MIFNFLDKRLPKCKNAKFIRIPSICRLVLHKHTDLVINDKGVLDLFTLKNDDYETTFYVMNASIGFINRTNEEYSKVSIVPLFDYKNVVYNFLVLNKEKYNLDKLDEAEPEEFVKAPSGDLYFIVKKGFLTIHNLKKGKLLFNSQKYDYYLFPFLKRKSPSSSILCSRPILNSFIVIMRIEEDENFNNPVIYIVDLVKGVVKKIEYDLKKYMIRLIYNVQDYLSNLFDEALHRNNLKENDREHFTPEKIFQNSEIEVRKWNGCKLTKYQNVMPIYDYCSFDVKIILKNKIAYTDCVFYMLFKITLSAFFEKGELNILMTTDENGYIEVCRHSGNKYNIPSNMVLFHKKYQLDNEYDISKSELYSITSLSGKYLITSRNPKSSQLPKYFHELYELVGRHYEYIGKIQDCYTLTIGSYSVSIAYISNYTSNSNRFFALILPNRIKKNTAISKNCTLNIGLEYISRPYFGLKYIRQPYFLYNKDDKHIIKIINWSVINEIVNRHKKQEGKSIIVELTEHIREININALLEHVAQKLQNKNIKYEEICYTYYFINETCNLYLFISLTTYEYQATCLRFVVVKYNVLKPISCSEICFLSSAYKLEMYIQAHTNRIIKIINRQRLFYEILYKMPKAKYNETLFSHYMIYLTLSYLGDILKLAKERSRVIYVNGSKFTLPMTSELYFGGLFLYDGELLLEDYDTYMEIKDIMHNRKAELDQLLIEYPRTGETYCIIDRYDNILVYRLKVKEASSEDGYNKFRLLIMVSEMELCQIIKTTQK